MKRGEIKKGSARWIIIQYFNDKHQLNKNFKNHKFRALVWYGMTMHDILHTEVTYYTTFYKMYQKGQLQKYFRVTKTEDKKTKDKRKQTVWRLNKLRSK